MPMQTFRKKPVVVQAIQWTGDNAEEIKAFVGDRKNGECRFLLPFEITGVWEHPCVYDELHDTWVNVMPGQWVIKGVRGEFYPCADDVFAETYEPVEAAYDAMREDVARVIRPRMQEIYRALRDGGIT